MSIHNQRGYFHFLQRRCKLAEAHFRLALQDDPADNYAHRLLACALNGQGRYEEAVVEARLAISLDLEDAYARYVLGLSLFRLGEIRQAESLAKEALALSPDPAYFAFAAELAVTRKQWSNVLDLAESGLEIDPQHIDCIKMSVEALLRLRRDEEAQRRVDMGLELYPQDAELHEHKAGMLFDDFQFARGVQHLKELMRSNPHASELYQHIIEAMDVRDPVYRLLCVGTTTICRAMNGMSDGVPHREILKEAALFVLQIFHMLLLVVKLPWTRSGRRALLGCAGLAR